MISQSFDWLRVCRPLRWHSANVCDVTTVQVSDRTVHKFYKMSLFMKIRLPSSFIFRYVRGQLRPRWCMHHQPDNIDIQEKIKLVQKSVYRVNGGLCSLVVSQILTEFRPERVTKGFKQNFATLILLNLNGLSKFVPTFTVYKIVFHLLIHIAAAAVWGNFLFTSGFNMKVLDVESVQEEKKHLSFY